MRTRRTTRTAVAVLATVIAALVGCLPLGSESVRGQAADEIASQLVLGPYVTAVSQGAARICWVSPPEVAGTCQLLGDAAGAKVEIKTSPITGREEVRRTAIVTGLKPGQTYKYVVTSGATRAEGSFQTAPAAGSSGPFTFLVLSDTQSYPRRHRPVVEAVLREPAPAFFLVCGDLTGDGPDWRRWRSEFFGPTAELLGRTALWPVRGNHEKNGVTYKELFQQPGDAPDYSFDYGNLHVVCLDQYEPGADSDLDEAGMARLAAWLDQDLAASKAEWRIVCYHQPTFNVGGHGSDWGRKEILPVLQKHGVDLVLAGHSHLHERFVPIGSPDEKPIIHLVISSTGGVSRSTSPSPMLAASRKGSAYYLFTIDGSRLRMVAKGVDGQVFDQLTLEKTAGRYQKEIMEAMVPTEDAMGLEKVFKSLEVDLPARPVAGQAMAVTLLGDLFPKGSRVKIASDAAGAWKVDAVSFTESGEPTALAATPPESVLLAESQGFSPPLTVAVNLEHKGRQYSYPAVPIQMTVETVRRLVPPPEPVRVAAAAAEITVDGNLADWKDVPYLRLPATRADSKDVKLAWRAEGLFGSVRVVQQAAIKSDPENPWESDGLELCLESDARRRLRVDSAGTPLRLFLLPQAGKDGGAMTVRLSYGRPTVKESVQAAWRKTADGYTIEFCIPTKSLTSSRLAANRKMGLHFALRRGDQIVEQFTDTAAFRSVASTPAYWGQIQLESRN